MQIQGYGRTACFELKVIPGLRMYDDLRNNRVFMDTIPIIWTAKELTVVSSFFLKTYFLYLSIVSDECLKKSVFYIAQIAIKIQFKSETKLWEKKSDLLRQQGFEAGPFRIVSLLTIQSHSYKIIATTTYSGSVGMLSFNMLSANPCHRPEQFCPQVQ